VSNAIRKRPRIGDVVEISTSRGLAYAQFTHKHDAPPRFGALIRVAPGFHDVRPASFSQVVAQRPQFMTFFPLGSACNRGIVSIVANEPIPEHAASFPTFRSGVRGPDGTVKNWWLWDGTRDKRIGALTQSMRSLPIRGIWNYTLLVERIVSGWRSEDVR
jgi:hypothetical protein